MIRDRELAQLKKYARGLGINVTTLKGTPSSQADALWSIDGKDIIIYTYSYDTKTDLILKLLHELGHHLEFVYRGRKLPDSLHYALDLTGPLAKKHRKAIYDNEVRGAAYHLIIAHEVGLKIPTWKIEVERDHQLAGYQHYYLTGKDLTMKQKSIIRKELIAKYKK